MKCSVDYSCDQLFLSIEIKFKSVFCPPWHKLRLLTNLLLGVACSECGSYFCSCWHRAPATIFFVLYGLRVCNDWTYFELFSWIIIDNLSTCFICTVHTHCLPLFTWVYFTILNRNPSYDCYLCQSCKCCNVLCQIMMANSWLMRLNLIIALNNHRVEPLFARFEKKVKVLAEHLRMDPIKIPKNIFNFIVFRDLLNILTSCLWVLF